MISLDVLQKKAIALSLVFLTSSSVVFSMDQAPAQEVANAAQVGWPLQETLDGWRSQQKFGDIFYAIKDPWFGRQDLRINLWLTSESVNCDVPLMHETVRRLASFTNDVETKKQLLAMVIASLVLAKGDADCCKGFAHLEKAVQPYDLLSQDYARLVSSITADVSYQDALDAARDFFQTVELDTLPCPAWACFVDKAGYFRSGISFGSPSEVLRNAYDIEGIKQLVKQVRHDSFTAAFSRFGLVTSWQDFFNLCAADLNQKKAAQAAVEDLTQSVRLLAISPEDLVPVDATAPAPEEVSAWERTSGFANESGQDTTSTWELEENVQQLNEAEDQSEEELVSSDQSQSESGDEMVSSEDNQSQSESEE